MRKAWKKAVSVLLTLVLIFGVLPAMNVSAEGEGGQGSRSIELNFAGGFGAGPGSSQLLPDHHFRHPGAGVFQP